MTQQQMRFVQVWLVALATLVTTMGCGDDEPTAEPVPAGTANPMMMPEASPGPAGTPAAGTAPGMDMAGMAAAPEPSAMNPMAPAQGAAPTPIPAPAMAPTSTLAAMGTPGSVSVAGGRFAPLSGYEMSVASGVALITRSATTTTVSLQVNGLSPTTAYPAHLHALPCALSAGGHYKIDPTVEDTVQENEIWPLFETDDKGAAWAEVVAQHVAREDGMSVVVHDPLADNAKMLCADLSFAPSDMEVAEGTLMPFAAAEDLDMSISGSATLTRTSNGTAATLSISGLSSQEAYIAHVHALPCAVNDAGGHYKLDPAVADTVEANELWLSLAPDGMGMAQGEVTSDHVARPDAQSIVVHRMAEASLKVACVDLPPARGADLRVSGVGVLLPAGIAAGLTQLMGAGYLTRLTSGETRAQLAISGAAPSVAYPVHVHDRPCAVEAAGGHYKYDPGVMETVEANEVWLPLTTDAQGAGTSEALAPSVLRADAQALVMHSAEGERLACFDLTIP